jgi:hypothetical protein
MSAQKGRTSFGDGARRTRCANLFLEGFRDAVAGKARNTSGYGEVAGSYTTVYNRGFARGAAAYLLAKGIALTVARIMVDGDGVNRLPSCQLKVPDGRGCRRDDGHDGACL